ncbi:MAG: winged helix-turn-helix domain-containing protein [Thermoactinomyces sp.]
MACLTDDGYLSESSKKLLQSIEKDFLTPQEIAKKTGLPLFKVRSGLRELESMELVIKEDNQYKMAPKALEYFNGKQD